MTVVVVIIIITVAVIMLFFVQPVVLLYQLIQFKWRTKRYWHIDWPLNLLMEAILKAGRYQRTLYDTCRQTENKSPRTGTLYVQRFLKTPCKRKNNKNNKVNG